MNKIKELRENYDKIQIPSRLDDAIEMGINKGKVKMKKNNGNKVFLNICASLVIGLIVFSATINIVPSFADSLIDIPILGKLVKVLQFENGEAKSGEITDGTDISSIEITDEDEIIINFSQNSQNQDIAPANTLEYSENPYIMSFTISGARMISAQADFEKMKDLKLVEDVYTLMTLDDSMIRFNIVFNKPINFEVVEMAEPASLILKISEDIEKTDETIHSIRTASYTKTERFGIIEEKLMKIYNIRVIKDIDNMFLLELFKSSDEGKAMEYMESIQDEMDIQLYLETRAHDEVPSVIDSDINVDENVIKQPEESTKEVFSTNEIVFPVSVTTSTDNYSANVIIGEKLSINDFNDKEKKIISFKYDEVELYKSSGEASYILTIKALNETIKISGVFTDFFTELEKHTTISK